MSRDNRWMILSVFLWGFGDGLSFYIKPLYLKELGADPVAIGSILALAWAATALTHIPAGYLADRFGRKQIIVAGWLLAVGAAVAMYLARTLEWFVSGLMAYMLTGFVLAPINAYVAQARGSQSIQRALSLVFAGYWGGTVLSPALGGLIGRAYGLRTVYGVAIFAFVFSTLAILPLRPQPLSAPAAGGTRYGPLFRNRRFLGYLALIFLALGAVQLGVPFLPNFIVEVRGYDVGVVGILGSLNSLGAAMLSLLLGQRLPRRGFLIGQTLMAVSMLLLLATTSLRWIGLAFFFQGGWNLARSMVAAQVGRVVEPAESGLAFGMSETVISLTMILAPLAAGALYQSAPALPIQISLALIGITLPVVWLFAPRRDAHTTELAPLPVAEISQLGDE